MEKSMKIFQQIPKIMDDIDAIGKNRNNQMQGFKFRGIDDIYNELHSKLAKHGVFTCPEVLSSVREERTTKSGGLMTYTVAQIRYTFYADDGSSVSALVIGEGADSGDKSSNKAMAIAHKYAMLQVFAIPTEDDKDPDTHSHELASKSSKPVKPIAPSPFKQEPDPFQAMADKPVKKEANENNKGRIAEPNAGTRGVVLPPSGDRVGPVPAGHIPPGTYIPEFGKFQGRSLASVNSKELMDYCQWLTSGEKKPSPDSPAGVFLIECRKFFKAKPK